MDSYSSLINLAVYDIAAGCHVEGRPYAYSNANRYYLVHLNSEVWSNEGPTIPAKHLRRSTDLFIDERVRDIPEQQNLFKVWVPGISTEYWAVKTKTGIIRLASFVDAWNFAIKYEGWCQEKPNKRTGIKFKGRRPLVDKTFNFVPYEPHTVKAKVYIEDASLFPQGEYQKGKILENIHVGQRKLLISEIEFLTKIENSEKKGGSKIIFYAGAASGDHIPFLEEMFPNMLFVLFDPGRFTIRPTKRIFIINDLFYGDEFDAFGCDIYFISDIRTAPEPCEDEDLARTQFDIEVAKNNKLQNEWVQNLHVRASMLKFRLPYDNGISFAPKGKQYTQAWARQSSTETRLISFYYSAPPGDVLVDRFPTLYSHRANEENLAYFNREYRCLTFYEFHSLFGANYDVLRESKVIGCYLDLFWKEVNNQMVFDWMAAIDRFIPRHNARVTNIISSKKLKRKQ